MTEPTYNDVVEAVAEQVCNICGEEINCHRKTEIEIDGRKKYRTSCSKADRLARQFLSTEVGNLEVAVVDRDASLPEVEIAISGTITIEHIVNHINISQQEMVESGFAKVVTE